VFFAVSALSSRPFFVILLLKRLSLTSSSEILSGVILLDFSFQSFIS